jgi:hypothetical protein
MPVTGFPTPGTLGVFGGVAGVFGVAAGLLEPGAVIVVGSTLGITLEGVLTAVFRLMMAGDSTLTGASRAMLELKLEDTVVDGVCVVGCVVDSVD